VVSRAHAKELALALPETVERDHHSRPSFRIADRIFATLWDKEHMNVMLDEPGILTTVQSDPETCEEIAGATSTEGMPRRSSAPIAAAIRSPEARPSRRLG
jgi:hypothetical protein